MNAIRRWLVLGALIGVVLSVSGCKRFVRSSIEDGVAEFLAAATSGSLETLFLGDAQAGGG